MTKSDAFIESKSLRESVIRHTEVLDKVKGLTMLPDDLHVTVQMAADYYEVGETAISSLIHDNRDELESDGLKSLKGDDFKKFVTSLKEEANIVSPKTRSLTIIPRRAILRMGMLLRDSEVAKQVRTYLLNLEESSPKRERVKAISKIPIGSLNNAVKIVSPFMDKLGLSPEVQALTVRTIYRAGGIELPFQIESPDKFKDTVQIARELGMYSKSDKPAFTAVSQLIKAQIEVLEGESETFMESRNGWQGPVEKYAPAVVEKVRQWLEDHGYPMQIKGSKKNYTVAYRREAVK
ncbi:hypothetical protein OYT88_11760 [Sporolactobacillus sp. CQH2019]|uniref:hypothetical protein n=1 Tax=Sporolactobacillus sp. CQH2019 TaxID=3023512 RepID=UPI002368A88E|nr:hypothetical protein [Sporolactobacillus sp. CQH2019]MDD9149229.1 hypothetical protein [Sporolactobacillus sp. CQH2019]